MKQCYYSEVLKKYFDDEESCMKAESDYEKEQEQLKLAKVETSKKKKELANKIEKAESELASAYEDLDNAYRQAKEILNKAKEESDKVVKDAKTKVYTKQDERIKAITDFNKEFGAYTTTYNGERALEELKRFNNLYSTMWARDLFNLF